MTTTPTLAEQIMAMDLYAYANKHELRVAAAALAEQAAPAGVRVKTLSWFEVEKSRYGGKYTADGYTIRYIEGRWLLDFAGGYSKSIWNFPDLDAAKAAAQADYAARITAAIEPDPTPALGWRAMQTAAAMICMRAQRETDSPNAQFVLNGARDAIIALPGPTDADLDRDAMNRPVVQELVDAANDVCNDSITPASDMGFARSVQRVCSAKARLRAALTAWRDAQ